MPEGIDPAEWWEHVKRSSHHIFEQLDKLVAELVALGVPLGSSQDVEQATADTQDGVNQ